MRRFIGSAVLALALTAPVVAMAQGRAGPLRVVVHADLQLLFLGGVTAFSTNRHPFLIYDTLYAMNLRSEPQPQIAEGHEELGKAAPPDYVMPERIHPDCHLRASA